MHSITQNIIRETLKKEHAEFERHFSLYSVKIVKDDQTLQLGIGDICKEPFKIIHCPISGADFDGLGAIDIADVVNLVLDLVKSFEEERIKLIEENNNERKRN